ncbi:MAG: cytochrome c-type biogenesis protein CcmH [Myxococcaceae bacterium]
MTALLLTLLLSATPHAPQQAGSALLDPVREARVQALGKLLRCPMCQGLSIADSGSSAARAQMDRVRELVAEGKTDDEIRAYFVARYGEWALLEPSAHGVNWLVWLLPGAVLLLGAVVIARLVRRPPSPKASVASSEGTAAQSDPYLEAVRAELKK